ncbi:hypothetical protein RKLH11_1437 [Rhodobacteraceae bacterium KLH11]|nr:hypothetical protein RKLH11_1437 [Rhodobacteraceae bacterium KLH11]
MLERMGADRLQFHPIDVADEMANGARLPGDWFFVVFEEAFNPVVEERSNLLKLFASGDVAKIPETASEARLICRSTDVSGRAFWTGAATENRHPGVGLTPFQAALPMFTYCSDAVYDELVAAGVMDFDWVTRIEEVDDSDTVPLTPGLAGEPVGLVHRVSVHSLERIRNEGDYVPFMKHLGRGDPLVHRPTRLDAGDEPIPDLYFHNALLVASAAAKAEIEALEPDLHRFEPVEFFKSFDPYEPLDAKTTHYVVVLGAPMSDPTIAEMSTGVSTSMRYGFAPVCRGLADRKAGLNVFDADKCGNRHLWARSRQPDSFPSDLCFSEALLAQLSTLNVPMGIPTDIPIYMRPSH